MIKQFTREEDYPGTDGFEAFHMHGTTEYDICKNAQKKPYPMA